MTKDPDFERIRRKAHELWEAEGQPHGRDLDHWEQAREIIAIEDSQASTLLPRTTGSTEPSEPRLAIDSLGDVPGLTDQGRDDLVDTSREPATTSPTAAAGKPSVGAAKKPAAPPAESKLAEKPAAAKAAPKPVASPSTSPTKSATPAVAAGKAPVPKEPLPAAKAATPVKPKT